MVKKSIELAKVLEMVNQLNGLLATKIPQVAKASITIVIEELLMGINAYGGFNNLYWMTKGCREWIDAGSIDEFPYKNRFVYGPTGQYHLEWKDDWVSDIEGEYARHYYTGKLEALMKKGKIAA